jgi:hypothetical protein
MAGSGCTGATDSGRKGVTSGSGDTEAGGGAVATRACGAFTPGTGAIAWTGLSGVAFGSAGTAGADAAAFTGGVGSRRGSLIVTRVAPALFAVRSSSSRSAGGSVGTSTRGGTSAPGVVDAVGSATRGPSGTATGGDGDQELDCALASAGSGGDGGTAARSGTTTGSPVAAGSDSGAGVGAGGASGAAGAGARVASVTGRLACPADGCRTSTASGTTGADSSHAAASRICSTGRSAGTETGAPADTDGLWSTRGSAAALATT